MISEEAAVGITGRGLGVNALAPHDLAFLVGDPEGIDLGNSLGLYTQHFANTPVFEALVAQAGLHAVDHGQQGQINVPCCFRDVCFKQVGQVAGCVVYGLDVSFPAVQQALDANGDNDGVDQEDECDQPAPEVRVGDRDGCVQGGQDRAPVQVDRLVTDYTFCQR